MDSRRVPHFIGRHDEREQIKELLSSDIQVLQIYGLPSVGKTELIRQVCQEISTELEVRILFRRITNGQWPSLVIAQFLKDTRNSQVLSVIILDCFENISEMEDFNQFCMENLWNLPRLKIIIIFQGLFPFKIEGYPDERLQVKPMNKEDARSLFYRRTKLLLDDFSDEQVDELIDYCGGLPGQIIELTEKVSQFPPNVSLTELFEFVRNNKSYCQSGDIFAKLDTYIKSLTPEQCHAFSEVVYFPGSFSVTDVTKMANYKNELETKFWFLYPLLGHGLLKSIDEENQQYQVPVLFQDYANQQLAHLRHEDTTKLKFSTIIGRSLMEAENLWKNGLIYEAFGIMTNNWPNVEKLLQQAIHCPSDGKSFQIYFKVVIEASKIISMCYPDEAKHFCKAIVDNAQVFGSEDQLALSMVSYGHTLVESSQKEALQLYKTSEGILRKHENHRYQLIILLYHMSDVYYRSGELQNGISCAEEALSIEVTGRDVADIQHVKTYAASFLAYNLIFATEYNQAEEILLQTLQEVGESGHPAVPILLNSLGLKEERSGGDMDKALTSYLSSLSKKRKIAKYQETLLVTTLCNVAGQLSKTKLKHDFALKFLFEAEGIRRRAVWVHMASALVVWNIGMVFMRKQLQRQALDKIKEAADLYGAANHRHYANAEVKVWLAHCHLLLNEAVEAKRIFLEVLRDGEMYQELRPQGEFVLNALEHLVHLSIQDPKEQATYIAEILKELARLNQCSGFGAIDPKRYRRLLLKYYQTLLKIEDDNAKSEPRAGIFMKSIPETCLPCQEVLKFGMCPAETYLQKISLLTPHRQFFENTDSTTARSLTHREQSKNKSGGRNLRNSTIGGCWTSGKPDNHSYLRSELSDRSDSDILPSPIRGFCGTSVDSESIEVLNELPDFNALFPLEELSVDSPGIPPGMRKDISTRPNSNTDFESPIKRVQPEMILTRPKSSTEPTGCQKVLDALPDFDALFPSEEVSVDYASNKIQQKGREHIPARQKSRAFLESLHGHQGMTDLLPDFDALSLEENKGVQAGMRGGIPARQNPRAETISKNDSVKSIFKSFSSNLSGQSRIQFGSNANTSENKRLWDLKRSTRIYQSKPFKHNQSHSFNNDVDVKVSVFSATQITNQALQNTPRFQRTHADSKTKQKSFISSQQMFNIRKPNGFQKSDSIHSELSLLTTKINLARTFYSSKNQHHSHSSKGQCLPNRSLNVRVSPVEEQQVAEHFWKKSMMKSKKTGEKMGLGHFADKNPASKYLQKSSTLQKPLLTTPAELKVSNVRSSTKTSKNSNIDIPKCQNNLQSKLPMNTLSQKQIAPQSFRLIQRREPVEHEERLN